MLAKCKRSLQEDKAIMISMNETERSNLRFSYALMILPLLGILGMSISAFLIPEGIFSVQGMLFTALFIFMLAVIILGIQLYNTTWKTARKRLNGGD